MTERQRVGQSERARYSGRAMSEPAHTNRLIHETSPYLLQHAHNPVDWYPWGAAALAKARREDKPILLSIGYSACHWCHVMEHESFEDEDVARVMNELFVCIKVDREERPDLDKIYQTSHQVLANRPGGWPLNMFLTPDDHMPFYGGTYFPKTPKHGMPAFTDILRQIASVYRDRRDAINEQNQSLREVFARLQPAPAAGAVDAAPIARATADLKRQFDTRYGGFGQAPKFPHPTSLELLLREWARGRDAGRADDELLHIARFTLDAMAAGGLYDQLGGGFFRYSVDERWVVPHFEKMLYDNAQLLPLYADLAQITDHERHAAIAADTAAWVMREMQAPAGGYYATLDADAEGHEGKFYVWSIEELRERVRGDEWDVLERRYGLRGRPNFEGAWHLNVHAPLSAIADPLQLTESDVAQRLAAAHATLMAARAQRVRPGRDEKILAGWNGLMIQGMAHAGRLLQRPALVASAERAFDFARTSMWRDGRLLAAYKDGKAHLAAYLDDYAFLIAGGLELLQARFRADDLGFVIALADVLLEKFEDRDHGAFYFTADDHERLVYRPKPTADEATPAGNGIAAQALQRLGHLLGETRYLDAAARALTALAGAVAQYPSAHASLLIALGEHLEPPQTVVLRGREPALSAWQARCAAGFAPGRIALAIPDDATALPGLLAQRTPQGEVTAYVCSGHSCRAPVTALAELETALARAAN